MKPGFRPDYQRVRRFLAKGGVLQREVLTTRDHQIVWYAATRDGRFFDADTCEWLRMKPSFKLDLQVWRLIEGPPTIYKLEYLSDTHN